MSAPRLTFRSLVLALAAAASVPAPATDPLPAYGANAAAITASGISSGGYMAVQFHVAHSGVVKGVGVLAGGPYYCAQGSLWTAYNNCTRPGVWTPLPPVELLATDAEIWERARLVDPTANLAAARVWLFSGGRDEIVRPPVVEAVERFYRRFAPAPNVALVRNPRAAHGMITLDAGVACELTAAPYLNDCDYDAAGELLKFLLGPLEPPAGKESGRVLRFDQKAFAGGDAYAIGMADSGFVHVPRACESEQCRVHVALHGCRMSVEAIGERFVREAGYNRWADSNRLIVLYPQTIARNGPALQGLRWSYVFNPRGCWDWWGYTGAQYATKAGPQIRAVKAMVDRLGAPRGR